MVGTGKSLALQEPETGRYLTDEIVRRYLPEYRFTCICKQIRIICYP